MKNYIFSFCALFIISFCVEAQKNNLQVKRNEKGLYLEHKVVASESFYSVGRKYNITPQEIADFNNLEMKKGLFIDQKIKIPLVASNFDQQGNAGAPVYYKTDDKEMLENISKNYNASMAKLYDWNNVDGDMVKADSKIIVGFLKGTSWPSVTIKPNPRKEKPVVKNEEKLQPIIEEKKEEVKPVKEGGKISNVEKPAEKKEEPIITRPEVKPAVTELGYFKPFYEQQVKSTPASNEETVTAGIFKTISGWNDAKYYLLIDEVQPGTIVKVINPVNNKAVYAKVLGQMSGIRQNAGLDIRISNAAASVLEISEQDKFIVNVKY